MIYKIIINFMIYIEGSMGIFIVYIGIIGPLFCFDYINFKASLVIKLINFNEIKNMVRLTMFVMNVATLLLEKWEDDFHTPEMGTWESVGTPETSKFDCKGQNTSH